jgi:hypothetical protein
MEKEKYKVVSRVQIKFTIRGLHRKIECLQLKDTCK